MSSAADAGPKPSRAPLGALRPLAPYALAYRVPDRSGARRAGRRLGGDACRADRGPADDRLRLFGRQRRPHPASISSAMIGVVAVLALASGARYYLVMTLGERVVADLRARPLRPSDPARSGLFRRREDRRDRLAPLRRHDPAQGDVRLVGLDRAAQCLPVRRRDRDDGRDQPETVGLRAGGHPDHRAAAVTPPDGRAAALPPRPGHGSPTRPPSPPKACRRCASCNPSSRNPSPPGAIATPPTAPMKRRGRWRRRAAIVTAAALFLAFGSVVAVLWLGAQDVVAGRMTGGELLAVRALRRVRRRRARPIVGSVERGVAGRRRRGADRRTHGRQAAHRRAGRAAPGSRSRLAASSPSKRSTSPIPGRDDEPCCGT